MTVSTNIRVEDVERFDPGKSSKSSIRTSAKDPVNQQRQSPQYSFADFKYKGLLGTGRSGKTLLSEFRESMIALKSADLSKAPLDILREMQHEVETYELLIKIQGKYIPKLVCYGYHGGGMYYVVGTTLVGSSLIKHQHITEQQRRNAINALKSIHDHGILHNDIRGENILLEDNDYDVYLIDFGMASHLDVNKKRWLFEEEERKLSRLLDNYI